ncbi:helix-turn-helix transcriptional regulator [Polymorphospora rubra]|uniref:helix-turn-helix transcriptional regulator n=1 Tax=Polymorphospora rubra TaxID=338584 RepID=UPI003401436E
MEKQWKIRSGWPFVARTAEVGAAVTRLFRAGEPGVLLTGAAGIGKSRLLAEIVGACRTDGAYVLVAGAAGGLPFPVTGEPATDGPVTGEGPGQAGTGVADVFATATRQLRAAAAGRACVLAVDDVHLLDDASVALVQHLAATAGVRILAATRTGHLATGPVRALLRRPFVRAMTVGALPRDAVAGCVEAALDGPVDGLTMHRLWRATRGNPLFLRHLLDAGLAGGALRRTDGMWRWTGAMRPGRELRDLVTGLLAATTAAEAAALAYAAHAEPVALEVLEALVDTAVLEELELRALIAVERHAERLVVRVGHPLYGAVLRAATGAQERPRIHRELARAARDGAAGPRTVAWRLAAGERIADAEVLAAAEQALADRDATLAGELARHVPGPAGVWLLGRAFVAQDRSVEAEELLGRHPDRPGPVVVRALNLLWNRRRPADAAQVVRGCAREGAPAPELRVARLAMAAFGGGPVPGPADLAEVAVDDPVVASVVDPLRALLLIHSGRPAYVADTFPAARMGAPRPWSSIRGTAVACRVRALQLTGRLDEASAAAEAGYRVAVTGPAAAEVALLASELGTCEMWAGRPARALPHFREARALLDEDSPVPLQVLVLAGYATCLAATGHPERAGTVLAEIGRRVPASSGPHDELRLAALQVEAWSGRPAAAAEDAARLGAAYRSAGRSTDAVQAFHLSARLRPTPAVAAALAEAAGGCDSELFRTFARHAGAAADADLDGLRSVVADLDRCGYRGLALEAASTAAGLAAAGGHDRVAAQLRVDVGRLHRWCDGYRPPWTVMAGPSAALTGRERQTCELAATGLPDDAIAERLGLSRRTVANHLHRAYAKLGVRGRRDLPAALGLPDPGLRVDPLWETAG